VAEYYKRFSLADHTLSRGGVLQGIFPWLITLSAVAEYYKGFFPG